MKKSKTLITTMLLFYIVRASFAADLKYQISGQIMDAETHTSIPYATITLHHATDSSMVIGTVSDIDGNFKLGKVVVGNYYLQISFIGYTNTYINNLTFLKDEKLIALGKINLGVESSLLDEIVVTAKVAPIESKIDRQVLDVTKNNGAVGGTAIDALKLSPAVQVDSDGNVKLRGSTKFIVLLNGKQTSLTPTEVLSQTPANNISKIEVITNPSAKYSAEGGAGIINIILKKGVASGFNGRINAMVGSKSKYSSDISLNLNKEKVNFSVGLDWRDYTKTAINNYNRYLKKEDTLHYAFMGQDRILNNSNLGFRFGVDYNPSEKNNFSYSIHSGYNETEVNINANTSSSSSPASYSKNAVNTYYLNQKPSFFTNNFTFTRQLKEEGNSLAVNVFYSYIDYYLLTSQVQSKADENSVIIDPQPYLQDIINDNFSNDLKIDIDYTKSVFEKSTLELGGSNHTYNRYLDITYKQFDYNANSWVNNQLYSNKYTFDENIYAGYVNMLTTFWEIDASVGIRAEFMDRILKQQSIEESYDFNRVNIFPSFSFSKNMGEKQSLSFSMSNRINRPDEYMMNPFPEFEDDYFYSEGNPYLIPEIVRNLELGHQFMNDNSMFSSNLYYRTTSDKIEQRLTIGDEDKIHTSYHNDAKDKSLGLELMGNFDITDWWSLNANTNLFHYQIEGNVDNDPFNRQNFAWTAQLVSSFNVKNSSIQLIGYYASETVRSQGELSNYYFLDASFNQELLKGRMTLNFQAKDILQSLNYQLKTEAGSMNLTGDFLNESPIFQFSVGYKLLDFKKKTKDVHTQFDM